MFPARIEEYVRPRTTAEALAAIARYPDGDAIFLAGGQSAMQAIKSRMLQPACIVDLQALEALRGIRHVGDRLEIGAMTRYVDIAADASLVPAFAALRDAAARVGDRQVRNRGTIGGSVCWNYVAACMPTVTLGLGARMHLASAAGERTVPVDEFFTGPLETAREDGEILLAVSFDEPGGRSGSAYAKWGLVTDALPVIGVCVRVELDDAGRCSDARVALTGLADGARRAPAAEDLIRGTDGAPAALEDALRAAADAADTHTDMSASADYRRQLIRTLGTEVARSAFDRAAS